MMIIFPEDLDFYEQSKAAQRRQRERRERQAERDEAWWRFVEEEWERGRASKTVAGQGDDEARKLLAAGA